MNKIFTFLYEVRSELRKVVWPKRDELVGSTIIVCLLAVAFAILLGFMDFSFGAFIKNLMS